MDEPRDPPPDPTPRAPLAAGLGRLSPVQAAYASYTQHAIDCDDCRNVDHTCEIAEELWRVYRRVGDAAGQAVADVARRA
ncbi:hypothetical protein ACFYVK_35670 [Streptomyces chartreusis]|uniref:hypothetical protein n=1 Tax=Streptomyces chartreusis TaxID=1969 RepID=UPI0036825C18